MRCKTCGYSLWNLAVRECPECGGSFRPGDYEFVPGTVRFCCPHCRHPRLGTDDRGHLSPRSFTCEQCGAAIDMDAMVLLPVEGLSDADTEPGVMPWLERGRRGLLKGFFGTIVLAMFRPGRLMRGVPKTSSVGEALVFGMATSALAFLIGIALPTVGSWAWTMFIWGSGPATWEVLWFSIGMFVLFFIAVGIIPIWALAAHMMLRLTGGSRFSVDRTLQALGYSAGANVVSVIPLVGAILGVLWWSVSAVIMVTTGQKVRAGRVVIAVYALPVMMAIVVGAGIWWIEAEMSSAMGSPQAYASYTADAVQNGVLANTFMNQGVAPAHALELVPAGNFTSWQPQEAVGLFCYYETLTMPDDVPVGDGTLTTFGALKHDDQGAVIKSLVEAMPDGVIAHRVGDFVFTYHGATLDGRNPELWVVVMVPDPDVNGAPGPYDTILIGTDEYPGSMQPIAYEDLAGELVEQNRYRATIGLAPLPNLLTVTNGRPAAAP